MTDDVDAAVHAACERLTAAIQEPVAVLVSSPGVAMGYGMSAADAARALSRGFGVVEPAEHVCPGCGFSVEHDPLLVMPDNTGRWHASCRDLKAARDRRAHRDGTWLVYVYGAASVAFVAVMMLIGRLAS